MSIQELAARLRAGATDGSDVSDALAEYAVEYAAAEQAFRDKKDD
jgi:hypothetical protein